MPCARSTVFFMALLVTVGSILEEKRDGLMARSLSAGKWKWETWMPPGDNKVRYFLEPTELMARCMK